MNLNQKIIRNKVGLLNLAEELGNVSKACKIMGFSRDTFYRYKSAVEDGGVEALLDKSRKVPNRKNRVDPIIEDAVRQVALDFPAFGQVRVSNELRKKGISVSPSGVRSVWLRNDLENFKKRLKKLEEKVASEGVILTESQVQALEKKKDDDIACGKIETLHPISPEVRSYYGILYPKARLEKEPTKMEASVRFIQIKRKRIVRSQEAKKPKKEWDIPKERWPTLGFHRHVN